MATLRNYFQVVPLKRNKTGFKRMKYVTPYVIPFTNDHKEKLNIGDIIEVTNFQESKFNRRFYLIINIIEKPKSKKATKRVIENIYYKKTKKGYKKSHIYNV
ncbi:hypothetical protein MPC59_003035 [Listeria monocytogenes]|nr:hypothetical protein [Listeria monocytogenes]EIZ6653604.1 hypothetical protein [Listeria monocytogenes]HDT8000322.1 hypothetical protein [Enterococcus faecalis]HDT8188126.1 hypothetical protein [Enterococcus faecalis]